MKKRNTLVLWHACMFLVCVLIANFHGVITRTIGFVGILHGVEFLYVLHNYRYIPRLRDFCPVFVHYHSGFLTVKLTAFCYMDFYMLWGGEIRCFSRRSGRHFTLISPGFFAK